VHINSVILNNGRWRYSHTMQMYTQIGLIITMEIIDVSKRIPCKLKETQRPVKGNMSEMRIMD
jgi:hypothetical protein